MKCINNSIDQESCYKIFAGIKTRRETVFTDNEI